MNKMQVLNLFKHMSQVFCERTVRDDGMKQQLKELWQQKFQDEPYV